MRTTRLILLLYWTALFTTFFLQWTSVAEVQLTPSDQIAAASPFPEPIIAVGEVTATDADTEALLSTLRSLPLQQSIPDQLALLEGYLQSHPASAWSPSLRANLGKYYANRGRFSLALQHWADTWPLVRDDRSVNGKKTADFVLAHWAELLAALGREQELAELLAQSQGRILDGGHLQQILNASVEAQARLANNPEQARRCGIAALYAAAQKLEVSPGTLQTLAGEVGTADGLTLARLAELAAARQWPFVAGRLLRDAPLPVPSVIHYKVDHFAAILDRDGSFYLVSDSVFRQPRWLKRQDILQETSGAFLIPENTLSDAFRRLSADESEQFIGRGYPNTIPDSEDSFEPAAEDVGLPGWRISEPYVNLWLDSAVIRYPLAGGKVQMMDLAFKQRNTRSSSGVYGFGASWECSWISYVDYYSEYDSESRKWAQVFQDIYIPLGGMRLYTPDGTTTEYFSQSTMTKQASPNFPNATWIVNYPNGSFQKYNADQDRGLGYRRAYLGSFTDPAGRITGWYYVVTNGTFRLNYLRDIDQRPSYFLYGSTNLARVTAVADPYGQTNQFYYDASGRLTNVVNPANFGGSFIYDNQGIVTNLTTPYGATAFKYTVDTNAGNVVTRSMTVTLPTGGKHLYMYRDQSTKLNSSNTVDLLSFSHPTNEVPNTGSLTNTFDNTWMDARNTFYWGPRLYAKLSSTFLSSGNFSDLTTDDYRLATLRHWLRNSAVQNQLNQTLSMERGPSPDGAADGQKVWYDYWGKSATVGTNYAGQTITNWYSRGNSPMPRFVGIVLPDGTTRFVYTEYISGVRPTKVVSTWSTSAGVGTRTNTFTYHTGGVDLKQVYDATGALVISNYWNTNHQIITSRNALNETTTYTYSTNSLRLLTSVKLPNGLITTNYYYTTGQTNFLQQSVVVGMGITNSYTYTNALVYTHTDERGLTTTNTYDKLQRIVAVARPDGTVRASYTNLSLLGVVDRMGFTNRFGYDAYGRRIWEADPLNRTNSYSYCDCGAIDSVSDALGQTTSFVYDNVGRLTTAVGPDGMGSTKIYNALGQLVTDIQPTGYGATNYYNNQGLVFAVSNALGRLAAVSYDVLDRATNSVDANGINISATFDTLGRPATRSYPDGGIERFGYTVNVPALTAYTNQLTNVVLYAYDLLARKTNETSLTLSTNKFTYDVSGNLKTLTDGNNQTTTWNYDLYGRSTNKVDAQTREVFRYSYDPNNRLTNRWSAQKGNSVYRYDPVGNLTNVDYAISTDITMKFDPLNRLTNMLDAAGTTIYTCGNIGQLLSEDGPWASDTVNYTYTTRRLTGASLDQPSASPWAVIYGYDSISRLTNITSPVGAFGYSYNVGQSVSAGSLLRKLVLPNAAYVTNEFDSVGRLLSTILRNSQDTHLNVHTYTYNLGGQPTRQTRKDADYVDYTYDALGQLKTGKGKEAGGTTNRLHEQFSYLYDAAGNLAWRTNNANVQQFKTDNLNRLTNVTRTGASTLTVAGATSTPATNVTVNSLTAVRYADLSFAKDGFTITSGWNSFTAIAWNDLGQSATNTISAYLPQSFDPKYDLNGNLTNDGRRVFYYDDENQLTTALVSNEWKSEFVYDGKFRRRVRKEYAWQSGAWTLTNEVRYVYDGNLVIQERNSNNSPLVTYTRGLDASGTLQGGGGIWGLLARTDNTAQSSTYYHADGVGNVTCLINSNTVVVARYLYDPYGNVLSMNGSLAEANAYRFASKEYHANSGLIYYGRRFYEPVFQRWINADPIGEKGGINLHRFASNVPTRRVDPYGLLVWYLPKDTKPGQWEWWCYGNCGPGYWNDAFNGYGSNRKGSGESGGGGGAASVPAPNNNSDTFASTVGDWIRDHIPLIGGVLGAAADIVSGVANTTIGFVTLGQSGTLARGLREIGSGVLGTAGFVWTAPYNALGLTWGGLGYAAGWAAYGMHLTQSKPHISNDNGWIQFKNHALNFFGDITLGADTSSFAPGMGPDKNITEGFSADVPGYTYGVHEGNHRPQARLLGPLYLPAYGIGIIGALLNPVYSGGPFGASNFMETGPYMPEIVGLPSRPWP